MDANGPLPKGASFAYDYALAALEDQGHRVDALDAKAGILLAADGVLAGLLLRMDSLLLQAPPEIAVPASITLVISILFALGSFVIRRFDTNLAPHAVAEFMHEEEGWLKWRFLGNLLRAIDLNRRKLRQKSGHLDVAVGGLIVTLLLMGGYLIQEVVARGG